MEGSWIPLLGILFQNTILITFEAKSITNIMGTVVVLQNQM